MLIGFVETLDGVDAFGESSLVLEAPFSHLLLHRHHLVRVRMQAHGELGALRAPLLHLAKALRALKIGLGCTIQGVVHS